MGKTEKPRVVSLVSFFNSSQDLFENSSGAFKFEINIQILEGTWPGNNLGLSYVGKISD